MQRRKFFEDRAIPSDLLDLSRWPQAIVDYDEKSNDDDETKRKKKALFDARKEAITIFITQNLPLRLIEEKTGIHDKEIYRLLERCLEDDGHGNIMGFRALIPYKRVDDYTRTEVNLRSEKKTGMFEWLLDTYPVLRDKIHNLFFKRADREPELPVLKVMYIWKGFIDACRTLGIKDSEYPLNTKHRARRSVERYIKQLEETYFTSDRYSEDAAQKAKATGQGDMNYPLIVEPFRAVQFDGHRIDVLAAVDFTTPEGDTITKIMDRFWLLVIIDVATRAILGWHLSLNKEYSALDVSACIRNALIPWKPREFTIPGLRYPEQGGFHSHVYRDLEWSVWNEFKIDNGKANLAKSVLNRLKDIVGCSINPGPVKTPQRRAIVERWFGVFEQNGFHRITSTVGSGPKDPKRNCAEEKAVQWKITYEHLHELTEIMIAGYNGRPNGGINHMSPLECLAQRKERFEIRKVPEHRRPEIEFITQEVGRTIRGSIKSGKRPYVYFEGVEYRNDVLSQSGGLIGTEIDLEVNIEDIRTIRAFLADGSELGILRAHGKWGISPHSLKTRKEINSLKERGIIHFLNTDDPIEIYHQYLAKRAIDKKSDRNRIQRLRNEAKADENSSSLAATVTKSTEVPIETSDNVAVFTRKSDVPKPTVKGDGAFEKSPDKGKGKIHFFNPKREPEKRTKVITY